MGGRRGRWGPPAQPSPGLASPCGSGHPLSLCLTCTEPVPWPRSVCRPPGPGGWCKHHAELLAARGTSSCPRQEQPEDVSSIPFSMLLMGKLRHGAVRCLVHGHTEREPWDCGRISGQLLSPLSAAALPRASPISFLSAEPLGNRQLSFTAPRHPAPRSPGGGLRGRRVRFPARGAGRGARPFQGCTECPGLWSLRGLPEGDCGGFPGQGRPRGSGDGDGENDSSLC